MSDDRQTDRQTDAGDLIICPVLCYISGTDNNNNNSSKLVKMRRNKMKVYTPEYGVNTLNLMLFCCVAMLFRVPEERLASR